MSEARGSLRWVAVGAVLPAVALFFAPLTVAAGNPSQFPDFWGVARSSFLVSLASGVVLLAMLAFVARVPVVRNVLAGLLVGAACAATVQSSFLRWNVGLLDGRPKDWGAFGANARIDLIVWVVIVGGVVVLSCRRRTRNATATLATGILFMGLVTTGSAVGSRMLSEEGPASTATNGDTLAFDDRNNVIVVVLDSFQSDAFDEIRRSHPEEVGFLAGFDYYPNTVGGYPTTRFAIPSVLNGSYYTNDGKFTASTLTKMNADSLPVAYRDRGYDVVGDFEMAPYPKMTGLNLTSRALRDTSYAGLPANHLRAIDAGLYRSSPLTLKKRIYDDDRWFLTELARSNSGIPFPLVEDAMFADSFARGATISPESAGTFKFFHLRGVHHPVMVNEKYEYVRDLQDSRTGYVNQARGALLLLRRILGTLGDLGVLDAAEVVVLGDHGAHNRPPVDMEGNPLDTTIAPEIIGQARPLLLHKRASAGTVALRVDSRSMHTAWVPCMLEVGSESDCRDHERSLRGEEVVRRHYRYEWVHDSWFDDHAPPMTVYEVSGDARKYQSWTNTGETLVSR